MTVVAGFERDANGLLRIDSVGAVASTWSGLPRTAAGLLATTTDPTGATMQAGLLRAPDGRLVTVDIATAVAPVREVGWLLDAADALVIDAVGPFQPVSQGLVRTAAGALGVTTA